MDSNLVKNRKQNQILHFASGYKRTILNVVRVWENGWTHILTDKGVEWIINPANVNCVEVEYLEALSEKRS